MKQHLPDFEHSSKPGSKPIYKHGTPTNTERVPTTEPHGHSDHLGRLLPPPSLRKPLYRSLLDIVRDLRQPAQLPPLQLTSMPVEVPSMQGLYAGNEWKAGALSIGINASIIGLLLLLGTTPAIRDVFTPPHDVWVMPDLRPPPIAKPEMRATPGGGGAATTTPDSLGALPRVSPRTFVPPTLNTVDNPKLPMSSTIVAGPDIQINASNLGNPLGILGIPGIGTGGPGKGIGPGKKDGVGPGDDTGAGKVYRLGTGGISQPIPITKPEPEYSEEARKAKQQGEILIELVVDEAGHPQNLKVLKGLGLGLDQKAIEAVTKWIFKPALKDGKPVPVFATVAVTFRLL